MQLSEDHKETISETINIGMGYAASTLNEMIGAHVNLQAPKIMLLSISELESELVNLIDENICMTTLSFEGSLMGSASLVFPNNSAANLVAILTNEKPGTPELDTLRAGTLHEVGNIIINSIMGSISNMIESHLEYSLPFYTEDTVPNIVESLDFNRDYHLIYARVRLSVRSFAIEGDLILLFNVGSLEVLLEKIDSARWTGRS